MFFDPDRARSVWKAMADELNITEQSARRQYPYRRKTTLVSAGQKYSVHVEFFGLRRVKVGATYKKVTVWCETAFAPTDQKGIEDAFWVLAESVVRRVSFSH